MGQSLARQTYLDSADLPALWALGFSRAQLFSLGIARAAIIGTAAACVVVPFAVLLSPLTPVGLAGIAEPDPGFAVDAAPLVAGAALVAFLTMLACAVPAWTAAQTAARREGPRPGGLPVREPRLHGTGGQAAQRAAGVEGGGRARRGRRPQRPARRRGRGQPGRGDHRGGFRAAAPPVE